MRINASSARAKHPTRTTAHPTTPPHLLLNGRALHTAVGVRLAPLCPAARARDAARPAAALQASMLRVGGHGPVREVLRTEGRSQQVSSVVSVSGEVTARCLLARLQTQNGNALYSFRSITWCGISIAAPAGRLGAPCSADRLPLDSSMAAHECSPALACMPIVALSALLTSRCQPGAQNT